MYKCVWPQEDKFKAIITSLEGPFELRKRDILLITKFSYKEECSGSTDQVAEEIQNVKTWKTSEASSEKKKKASNHQVGKKNFSWVRFDPDPESFEWTFAERGLDLSIEDHWHLMTYSSRHRPTPLSLSVSPWPYSHAFLKADLSRSPDDCSKSMKLALAG